MDTLYKRQRTFVSGTTLTTPTTLNTTITTTFVLTLTVTSPIFSFSIFSTFVLSFSSPGQVLLQKRNNPTNASTPLTISAILFFSFIWNIINSQSIKIERSIKIESCKMRDTSSTLLPTFNVIRLFYDVLLYFINSIKESISIVTKRNVKKESLISFVLRDRVCKKG